MTRRILSLALFCLLTQMAVARVVRTELTNYVIAANSDGLAVDPDTDEILPGKDAFARFVNHLLDNAEEFARTNNTHRPHRGFKPGDPVPVMILVHVHGGMNSIDDTRARVAEFADTIKNEEKDWFYPIFVRWPSSFLSTYSEHLLYVRNGNINRRSGPWLSPLVLTTDLLQFVAHAPMDWYYQTLNTRDQMVMHYGWQWTRTHWLSHNWQVAWFNRDQPNVRLSRFYYSALDGVARSAQDIVEAPIRGTVGTLYQSTVAQGAWKTMKRRTTQMVYPAPLFEKTHFSSDLRALAAGQFFELLNERAKKANSGTRFQYRICLIGHSMGAIVLNKVLTEFREDWIKADGLTDIVYMGAACSVADTVGAIKPLLLACNTNGGNGLRFHNLTLNRVAEISERSAFGIVPSGSLLENIDQHLESPEATVNRTMGSEVNVLTAISLFSDPTNNLAQYCDFKGFDRRSGCIPQKHGDFNQCPFWLPSFWDPKTIIFASKTGTNIHTYNCYPDDWTGHSNSVRTLPKQVRPEGANKHIQRADKAQKAAVK